MAMQKCPVCEGRQTVPAGFYRESINATGREKCRSCNGSGMVFSPEARKQSLHPLGAGEKTPVWNGLRDGISVSDAFDTD